MLGERLGRLSWMPWKARGSRRSPERQMYAFPFVDSWTDDLAGRRSVGYVYYTDSALRYDLMGIIPRRGFPCVWTPTIRFGMAADAINDLRISMDLTVRLMEVLTDDPDLPSDGPVLIEDLGRRLGAPSYVFCRLLSLCLFCLFGLPLV